MMKFTEGQADFLINSRINFNTAMAEMGNYHLVGNAQPLPKYVWEMVDRQSVTIQRDVLSVYSDLASSVSMPMPIGKLIHMYPQISDSGGPANVSLDGRGKGKADTTVVNYQGTPLPIVDDVVTYGWRQIEAARTEGYNVLQEGGIMNSQRKVAEKLEDIVLNGDASIVVGNTAMYGLRNAPNRGTNTHGFTLRGVTGAEWLTAVKKGLDTLQSKNFFTTGVTVYLNWQDWFYASVSDYTANYPKTILGRLQEITGLNFVPASKVPADEMLFVVKRPDVVTLLNGMPLSTRPQMRTNAEDEYTFITMAAAALEVKSDANGNCGVVQITKA
jgi:hypothetical protein